MLTVKVCLGEDIRRFQAERTIRYSELDETLKQLYFPSCSPPFFVKYVDEDGDLVTVSSDNELEEAIRLAIRSGEDESKAMLRLYIDVPTYSASSEGAFSDRGSLSQSWTSVCASPRPAGQVDIGHSASAASSISDLLAPLAGSSAQALPLDQASTPRSLSSSIDQLSGFVNQLGMALGGPTVADALQQALQLAAASAPSSDSAASRPVSVPFPQSPLPISPSPVPSGCSDTSTRAALPILSPATVRSVSTPDNSAPARTATPLGFVFGQALAPRSPAAAPADPASASQLAPVIAGIVETMRTHAQMAPLVLALVQSLQSSLPAVMSIVQQAGTRAAAAAAPPVPPEVMASVVTALVHSVQSSAFTTTLLTVLNNLATVTAAASAPAAPLPVASSPDVVPAMAVCTGPVVGAASPQPAAQEASVVADSVAEESSPAPAPRADAVETSMMEAAVQASLDQQGPASTAAPAETGPRAGVVPAGDDLGAGQVYPEQQHQQTPRGPSFVERIGRTILGSVGRPRRNLDEEQRMLEQALEESRKDEEEEERMVQLAMEESQRFARELAREREAGDMEFTRGQELSGENTTTHVSFDGPWRQFDSEGDTAADESGMRWPHSVGRRASARAARDEMARARREERRAARAIRGEVTQARRVAEIARMESERTRAEVEHEVRDVDREVEYERRLMEAALEDSLRVRASEDRFARASERAAFFADQERAAHAMGGARPRDVQQPNREESELEMLRLLDGSRMTRSWERVPERDANAHFDDGRAAQLGRPAPNRYEPPSMSTTRGFGNANSNSMQGWHLRWTRGPQPIWDPCVNHTEPVPSAPPAPAGQHPRHPPGWEPESAPAVGMPPASIRNAGSDDDSLFDLSYFEEQVRGRHLTEAAAYLRLFITPASDNLAHRMFNNIDRLSELDTTVRSGGRVSESEMRDVEHELVGFAQVHPTLSPSAPERVPTAAAARAVGVPARTMLSDDAASALLDAALDELEYSGRVVNSAFTQASAASGHVELQHQPPQAAASGSSSRSRWPPTRTHSGGRAGGRSSWGRYMATFDADVTVPDGTTFAPGQRFIKTWRLRNTGTCEWATKCSLQCIGGDPFVYSVGTRVHLYRPVPPGMTVEVSVEMTAPVSPGTYRSEWQMSGPHGQLFGARMWALFAVNDALPAPPMPVFNSVPPPQHELPAPLPDANPDVAAEPAANLVSEEDYDRLLCQLMDMGFNDVEMNVAMLRANSGNLDATIASLVAL